MVNGRKTVRTGTRLGKRTVKSFRRAGTVLRKTAKRVKPRLITPAEAARRRGRRIPTRSTIVRRALARRRALATRRRKVGREVRRRLR